MPNVVLKTIDLTKRFGSQAAVDRLNLEVYEGDIFGFLGPNGAGKTTTMRMIVGLVRPTAGRIEINGLDVRRRFLDAIAQVGALIDIPAFYGHLSGWTNLAIIARTVGGVPQSRITEVLEEVGLHDQRKKKVKAYSHGMRQRLGIAQAMLTRPPFLILDEPTIGLDPEGKFDLLDLLRALAREQKITIFISSHLLEEVEEICNRVAIIDAGRLLVCGEVRSLLAEELRTYRLLVSDPTRAQALLQSQPWIRTAVAEDNRLLVTLRNEDASRIATLLVSQGIELSELSPRLKSLRTLFMEIVQGRGPQQMTNAE
jgi:ABC-2 type transport system ATP-binding protein